MLLYNQYKATDIQGAQLERNKMAYQVSSNHTFMLGSRSAAELNSNYKSSNVYGIFYLKSSYGIDFGLSRSFLEKKPDIKFAVNDMLNTRGKRTITNSFPNSSYDIRTTYDSRITRLSLSYRFGNNKLKAVDKKGSANEEEKRLNKN